MQIRFIETFRVSAPECAQTPEVDAVAFARTRLKLDPDEKQEEILRSGARRGILNCSRQWGKTEVIAAKVVHHIVTRPKRLVIVASPGERQSGSFMMRVEAMLRTLRIRRTRDRVNKFSAVLPNGSSVVALPQVPDKVRGFAGATMLVLEEAAFMSDEMHAAVLPMLATTNGPLWMLSTSNAKSGFFYETWQHGGPEWHRVRVLATECPRISPEFLETQVAELGMERFRREFFCEFTGDGADAFDRDVVEEALDDSVEPMALLGDDARLTAQQVSRLWLTERADQAFIVAVDLGKKTDYSTIVVLEQCGDELHVRGAERAKLGTPYYEVVQMVRGVVSSPRLRGRCSLVVDGSGVGEPVVELLRRGDFGCKVTSVMITGGRTARAGRRPGTRNVPKFDLMAGLQVAIESGELKIAKRMKEAGTLVRELLDVRVKPNGSMSAEGVGKHDDLVMATALAVWKARRGRNDWGGGGFC